MLLAWGDESCVSAGERSAYIVAAVTLRPSAVSTARAEAAQLRRTGGRTKSHWYDAGARARQDLERALAAAPVQILGVVRECDPSERDERRRRHCLATLLPTLSTRGCRELILESRGSHADRRDIEFTNTLSSRGLGLDLRVGHRPGAEEPLLWLADIAYGLTASAWRTGSLSSLAGMAVIHT